MAWTKRTTVGVPSSSGNMGEGLTYDPKRSCVVLFANKNDEVWTFKTGNGIQNRPEPVKTVGGVTTSQGITLQWTAPKSGTPPLRYRIYRSTWEDNIPFAGNCPSSNCQSAIVPGPYLLIDSTSNLTLTDQDTALHHSDTFHSYYIAAVSASGIESDPSTPIYTRLRVPFGLVATPLTANRVVLRWKPKREEDVVGYNVYRAQRNFPYHLKMKSNRLNSTLLTSPMFIDSTVRLCATALCADSLALYVVTAVNRLGKESGFSPFASTAPDWPTHLWADTVNKRLHWSPSRSGNIGQYRIYQAMQRDWNTGSTTFSLLSTTTDTTWSFANKLTLACYRVRAYSKMGQLGHGSDVMALQTKDSLHFGMHKADFQTEPPTPDTFYNDVPPLETAIEQGQFLENGGLSVSLSPNPFNPKLHLTLTLSPTLGEHNPPRYTLYRPDGSKVTSGTLTLQNGMGKTVLDGSHLSSGLYLVKVEYGKASVKKTITLLK